MRAFGVVFICTAALLSCAAVPRDSSLIGLCFKTVKPISIWQGYNNVYVGEFLLSINKPSNLTESQASVGQISEGTKVQLIEVLDGQNGSDGHFLRTIFKIMDGENAGLIADAPACVPYHPRPRWISSCTLDPNALTFNDELLESCDK